MAQQTKSPVKTWTKPELNRLGKLADVAQTNSGPNQCGATGGGCTPKS